MKNLKNNKYGNRKVKIGGETFDSRRELQRWAELNILLRAKKIANLERQVKFELMPAQYGEDGKVIERECAYVADFVYDDLESGKYVVEDAKGFRTPEYIIKRKLMLALNMAIEALKKQIPKKKKKRNECPECGYSYAFEEYCPYCGQAIDWSGEDD